MPDAPISGTTLLVAGADPATAGRIVAALEASGAADVAFEAAPAAAAQRVITHPTDAVLVLGEAAGALRAALDPLGLDGGPPVVEIEGDVAAASGGPALAVRHLAEAITSRRLRDRVDGLEAAMAETTLQQTHQLELAREETLQRLARLAEYRDDNSWEHTERVAQLAARLAARLDVPRRTIEQLRRTAPLHDIGKIAIPDTILLKPGKLSPHEFEVIKTHTVVGAQVLGGGTSDLIRVGEQVVRSHHERWDGTGYPDGLAGEDIPLVARLVQIADVFDILMHERPHKEAWLLEDAAAEIARGAGTQFDPAIVAAFMDLGPDVWRAPAPMRYALP